MDAAARSAIRKSKAAGEADLHPDDILRSMAATLLSDNSAVYQVNTLPDRQPPALETIKKPPKEIFYRKTQLFATRVPDEVGAKRCTCKYLCHGAPAEVKCLSCVMYDPKGLGFFCKMCFDARHPWYRVPHIFEDIAKDETVQHTLKVSHRRAEMVRYEQEGQDLYKALLDNKPKLAFVADDNKVAYGLKEAGYRTLALEQRMRDFRKELRSDIRSKPLQADAANPALAATGGVYTLSLSDDEAAGAIARAYRGYKVRSVLSTFIMHRIVRGHDHATGKEFFFDKLTKKSSWRKPLLLLDCDVAKMGVKSTLDKERKAKARAEAEAAAKVAEGATQQELQRQAEEEERGRKKNPYAVRAGRKGYGTKSKSPGAGGSSPRKQPPLSPPRKSASPGRQRRGGVGKLA